MVNTTTITPEPPADLLGRIGELGARGRVLAAARNAGGWVLGGPQPT